MLLMSTSQGKSTWTWTLQSIPALDGDFIHLYGSLSLKEAKFVQVPIIIGVTSNEGYDPLPDGLSRWDQIPQLLRGKAQIPIGKKISLIDFPSKGNRMLRRGYRYLETSWRRYPFSVIERLLSFYPEAEHSERLDPPIKGISDLDTYNRVDHLLGDLDYNAAKRLQCESYARVTSCYSYRFDASERPHTSNPHEGATHSAEIGPVFQNYDGVGYDEDNNPFSSETAWVFRDGQGHRSHVGRFHHKA